MNSVFFVIANYPPGGRAQAQPHADFIQGMLNRAKEKLGAEPTLVRCNPGDREALSALAGITIEINTIVQPNEFWLGIKQEASNGHAE